MFVQHSNFGPQSIIKCGHTDGLHNSGDHLHQFFEMEIVLDGEIEISLEGEKTLTKAGEIAIIPPFKVHSFHTPKYVKQVIYVISDNFLPESISPAELCSKRRSHVFTPSAELWRFILDSGFTDIGKVYDPIKEAAVIHKHKAMIHMILAEYFCNVPVIPSYTSYNALSKILSYMAESFTENLSLERVGAELGYSPKYVSNCLRSVTNFGFRRILNSLRVERAKFMLKTTDKTVLAIAMECGFTSESGFHEIFKELTGTTPGVYRAELKRKIK